MPGKQITEFKEQEILEAVIIADTFDDFLHPLTLEMPKILLPFLNLPIIEHVLDSLLDSSVEKTYIFICNQSDQVRKYLNESKWNCEKCEMQVHLIVSSNCYSIGDALRDIGNRYLIRSDFILLYGDTIFNMSLLRVLNIHKDRKNWDKNIILTILLKEFESDPLEKEEIVLLVNKESGQKVLKSKCISNMNQINKISDDEFIALDCQISICSPAVLLLMIDNFDYESINDLVNGIVDNEEVHGNTIYYHMLKKNEYASRVRGFRSYEANTLKALNNYSTTMERNIVSIQVDVFFNGFQLHGSVINEKKRSVQNATVGKNTIIGENSTIYNSVIGKNCKIGNNVKMENCIVFDDVIIEDGCNLTCFISNFAHIEKDVVIPKGCFIGNHVRVFSTDSLSINTRLVSHSMSHTLKALSPKNGGFIYCMSGASISESDILEKDDDSEDEECYDDDAEYTECYQELIKNFKRSVKENISMENVIVEMNSIKHAYGMHIRELHIHLMRALLNFPIKFPAFASECKNYFSRLRQMIEMHLPLLHHYIKTREAEHDILIAMEEVSGEEPEVLKYIVSIAKLLYDEDILSDDEIIAWWKDGNINHDVRLKTKMAPFINWLETADEE